MWPCECHVIMRIIVTFQILKKFAVKLRSSDKESTDKTTVIPRSKSILTAVSQSGNKAISALSKSTEKVSTAISKSSDKIGTALSKSTDKIHNIVNIAPEKVTLCYTLSVVC